MKRLLSHINIREESGGVAVFVAIFMVVLLGFTALVIDGGSLYLEKSKLQKALDAAVLGGAQKVLIGEIEAKTAAKELSQQNGYSLADSDIEAIHRTSVKATKTIVVPLTFAKIIGVNDATVSASAKAIVAPITICGGVVPIAVEKE